MPAGLPPDVPRGFRHDAAVGHFHETDRIPRVNLAMMNQRVRSSISPDGRWPTEMPWTKGTGVFEGHQKCKSVDCAFEKPAGGGITLQGSVAAVLIRQYSRISARVNLFRIARIHVAMCFPLTSADHAAFGSQKLHQGAVEHHFLPGKASRLPFMTTGPRRFYEFLGVPRRSRGGAQRRGRLLTRAPSLVPLFFKADQRKGEC
jgi:hypothetical protein